MTSKPKSHDDESLNFGKIEKEMNEAVNADARYCRENDAKFRAVHQKVATYEEFQDIVKASHIKPLEKGDKMDSIVFNQPWNIAAAKNSTGDMTESGGIAQTKNIPKSGQEFVQYWRRYLKSVGDQYAYLLYIGSGNLLTIFKTEISFGLLGDMIQALEFHITESDTANVINILKALSLTNRFTLSLQFLSSSEKEKLKSLFDKLNGFCEKNMPELTPRLNILCETYKVKN